MEDGRRDAPAEEVQQATPEHQSGGERDDAGPSDRQSDSEGGPAAGRSTNERVPQQHWAYTIHQWAGMPETGAFDAAVRRAVRNRSNGLTYFVGQLERAPGTGKLHLQCYAQFEGRRTGAALQQALGMCGDVPCITGPHWTACRGGSDDNRRYCTKEESAARGEPGEDGLLGRKLYTIEFGIIRGIRGRRAPGGAGERAGGARAALAQALQEAAASGGSFEGILRDHVQQLLSCGRTAEVDG